MGDVLDGLFLRLALGSRRAKATGERPASGVIHAEHGGAAAPATRCRAALVRGRKQCAQAAEAVRRDEAERDQLRKCFLDVNPQYPGGVDQFVEEERAMIAKAVEHRLGAHRRPG